MPTVGITEQQAGTLTLALTPELQAELCRSPNEALLHLSDPAVRDWLIRAARRQYNVDMSSFSDMHQPLRDDAAELFRWPAEKVSAAVLWAAWHRMVAGLGPEDYHWIRRETGADGTEVLIVDIP